MGFGSFGAGLAQGLPEGTNLYNALQMQPLQKQQAQQQLSQGQLELQQAQQNTPFKLPNGQTIMLSADKAAQLGEALAGQQAYANALYGRTALNQQFDSGKLNQSDEQRLGGIPSALPIHNGITALAQAYADSMQGDNNAAQTALTQAKQYLAGTKLSPYIASVGNSPANIPAVYDSLVTQGAIETNRLSTGSKVIPQGAELQSLKTTLYPTLAEIQASPDIAMGKLDVTTDAYLLAPYKAALSQLVRGGTDQNGEPINPALRASFDQISQQYNQTKNGIYRIPGSGPQGTPMPEMQGVIPELTNGGLPRTATLPGTALPMASQQAAPLGSSLGLGGMPWNPNQAQQAPQAQQGTGLPGSVPLGQNPSPKRYQVLSVSPSGL